MSYLLFSPKIEFVFKKIFGNENKPEILISFLNAIIDSKNLITKVMIQNSKSIKYNVLDITAITNKNSKINFEIRLENESNIIEKKIWDWKEINASQLNKKIYIKILDFKYLKTDKMHTIYKSKKTDVEEIHFIELPKLKERSNENEEVDILKLWIEFINNPIKNLDINIKEIRAAREELINLSSDKKVIERYEQRKFAELDRINAIENIKKKAFEESKKQVAIEIARKLLKKGFDVEEICEITRVTKEELLNKS